MNDTYRHDDTRPDDDVDARVDPRLDALLDRAAAALGDDVPADDVIAAAGARAWARIAADATAAGRDASAMGAAGQTDYRALIPDFLAGRLPPAQALLVADHVREDVAFRADVEAARRGTTARRLTVVTADREGASTASPAGVPWYRRVPARPLAVAAAVAIAVGTFVFARDIVQPNRVLAQVADVEGGLIAIADGAGSRPLAAGDAIRPRQPLRALGGRGAVVTLGDGSTIELGPRAEIALASRWNGVAVNLQRGDIIVHAADQGRGQLHVATEDLDVAVKGTIFSVRQGTKGSRVSVVEGEVEVVGAQGRRTLMPGMQYASRAAVGAVPVADDIAWSRHQAEYVKLLASLDRLGDEIDAAIQRPAPRQASALLDQVPADTVVYVALPNLGETVADAYTRFREGVAADPVLRDWWAKGIADDPQNEARLDKLIATLGEIGGAAGNEIVVAAGVVDVAGVEELAPPVVMAEVDDPAAFKALLETRFAELAAEMRDGGDAAADADVEPLRILTDRAALDAAAEAEASRFDRVDAGAAGAADDDVGPAAAGNNSDAADSDRPDAGDDVLYVWLGGGPMLMSPSATSLAAATSAARGLPADFRAAVSSAYRGGVDALLAVDVQRMAALARAHSNSDGSHPGDTNPDRAGDDPSPADALNWAGLDDARYAIGTQVTVDGRSQLQAELTFADERHGMAGWLAAPGPMGALDFISPDAYVAGAALIDSPARIVAEFLGLIDKADPDATHDPDVALGAETLTDLSKALGGEVAFAIDGPVLPKPSWKMVVEVTDAAALQAALGRAVDAVNGRLADHPQRLTLASAKSGGRDVWSLSVSGDDGDDGAGADLRAMHWLYADGYLVAASDPGLLDSALRTRESGVTLRRAEAFVAALPTGAETDFSAVMWQDFGRLTQVLAAGAGVGGAGDGTGDVGEPDIAALGSLTGVAPSLVYAWAEPNRLRFAASSDTSPLGVGTLLRILGLSAGTEPPGSVGPGGPALDGLPMPGSPFGGGVWEPNT